AIRFPHRAGEALLVLLRSREFIWLDSQRAGTESRSMSLVTDLLPGSGENKIYANERKEANAMPHRRNDLEFAVMNLQLGPLRPRVHEILDQHRAALGPIDEQTEDDRVWRLSMHRMDMRQYSVADEVVEDASD